ALLGAHFLVDIAVQNAGKGGPEAREVGAAVTLGDVVGIGVDAFLVAIIPLQRNLYGDAILHSLCVEVEDLVHRRFIGVQIGHKGLQASVVLEELFLVCALILEANGNASIQEGELPKLLRQNVIVKFNIGEGLCGGLEVAGGASQLCFTHHCQRSKWDTMRIVLLMDLAVSTYGQL